MEELSSLQQAMGQRLYARSRSMLLPEVQVNTHDRTPVAGTGSPEVPDESDKGKSKCSCSTHEGRHLLSRRRGGQSARIRRALTCNVRMEISCHIDAPLLGQTKGHWGKPRQLEPFHEAFVGHLPDLTLVFTDLGLVPGPFR